MSRAPGITKIGNDYAVAAGRDFYADIPKAVWAAIAVSAITQGGDYLDDARVRIAEEWDALHVNGIVPQAPRSSPRRRRMRIPIRVFIPVRNAAPDAADRPPIQPLPEPLSMRAHVQAHLLAEMAINGVPLGAADIALLSLRVRAMAEEIESLEAEARRSRR